MPTDPIANGISPFIPAPLVAEVQARCRQLAAVTIALRRAWIAAAGVPALRLWRLWAGLWLDHDWRARWPARLALRQAQRSGVPQVIAATRAILAVGEAPRDRPPGEPPSAR